MKKVVIDQIDIQKAQGLALKKDAQNQALQAIIKNAQDNYSKGMESLKEEEKNFWVSLQDKYALDPKKQYNMVSGNGEVYFEEIVKKEGERNE